MRGRHHVHHIGPRYTIRIESKGYRDWIETLARTRRKSTVK